MKIKDTVKTNHIPIEQSVTDFTTLNTTEIIRITHWSRKVQEDAEDLDLIVKEDE